MSDWNCIHGVARYLRCIMCEEITRLRNVEGTVPALNDRIAELEAALKPFAAIVPSSLHPEDGSDNEAYVMVLKDTYGNPTAFTGGDLARARTAYGKAGE